MNIETPFAPLLDLLVKSAALILIGTALIGALRRTSAANRHAVSAAIFAALLLLPLTKLMPARWSFSLAKPNAPAVNVRLPIIGAAQGGSGRTSAQPVENAAPPAPRAPLVIPWKKLAVAVWLAGAALLLARRALIALRLRAMVRGSFPIEDERLAAKVRSLVGSGGVRAEVRESDLCQVPLASGFARPVVLLPIGAADWSDAYVSSALRHELGHIRRRDCITRLLADVLCAFYWVNPLVWFAARQMRLAQEQACDDLVLNSGAPAAEYAGQLVKAVRSLQGDRLNACHALAMAQPSTLETRVLAIVDAQRDRSARSVRGTFAGVAFAATALALCTTAQVSGAEKKKPATAADARGPQVLIEAKFIEITGEPKGLPDFLKQLTREKAPSTDAVVSERADAATLKGLSEMKGVHVLSSPRITTHSKQRAVISVGREMSYPTAWDKDAKTGAWKGTKLETKNVGVTFEVTPEVNADGTIALHMTPQLVEFEGYKDLDANPAAVIGKPDAAKPASERILTVLDEKQVPEGHRAQPVFTMRKMSASAAVKAGEMIALGGLSKGGGPDGPRHLVVLVTANIVKPDDAPDGKPAKVADGKPVEVASKKADEANEGGAKADEQWILPKVVFKDATLREVVEFLVAKSKTLDAAGKGVNIVLKNADKIGDLKITLSLTDIPLTEVLRYVAALTGCEVVREEFAFVIGPKPVRKVPVPDADQEKGAAGNAAPAKPAGAALKKAGAIIVPKIDFRDVTLSEAVDFLRLKSKDLDPDKKGVNLVVMPAAAGGDARITLTLTDAPLSEVLRWVAMLAGCEIVADENAITLRPAAK